MGSFEKRYADLDRLVTGTCKIPFLDTEFVPQGICWLEGDLVAMAFYDMDKKQPGRLAVVDFKSGVVQHEYALYAQDHSPYLGHGSGLARHEGSLWLTDWQRLHRYPISDVLHGKEPRLLAVGSLPVDARGSFLSSDCACLWTGDFVHGSKYEAWSHHTHPVAKKRAWAAAYEVDAQGVPARKDGYLVEGQWVHAPLKVVHLRDDVQGFVRCGERIALSVSWSAADSVLEIHPDPFTAEPSRLELPGGFSTNAWFLDRCHHVKLIAMPAGSQNLDWDDRRRLLVTFEGMHRSKRGAWKEKGALPWGKALAIDLQGLR